MCHGARLKCQFSDLSLQVTMMFESFLRPRLPLLFFGLFLFFVCTQAQGIESLDEIEQECIHPSKQADPCQFVRMYCGSEAGLINYLELRYCTVSPQNAIWFFALMLFLTIAYFYALFRVSDVHLTTALQSISDYLGLSSEIAGLTLLSFGNGAPDLFTAFAGVSSGDYELIFGSTIGSAMFVLNVVLGSIIIASYFRHKNEVLSFLEQNPPEIPRAGSSFEGEVEQPRPASSSESFVRLRRKLQSITRALRLDACNERSSSYCVIQFRGNSVDRFSHLRNMSIYTIAVFMLLAIFNDGTVHWYDPVILLVYYVFFLAFFIGRHFYLERTARKKKEASLKLNQITSPSSALFRGASFDSVRTFDNNLMVSDSARLFLDAKPVTPGISEGSLKQPVFDIPQLIVTPADIPEDRYILVFGPEQHYLYSNFPLVMIP
ncbi:hypothetical protein K493DRAFT_811 [Basidiobolus meristosporus CBS 931.73]|uniref:Sodium/calcium exchanger membrane region domain-containing protein n=1 Tax=Basidiobolus meristosporus CBS 931.73 TaxID=1314790 RepID=A0A1Y1ZAT1_9FUNG|nr:hypothetical protein K493DRAFT_811 [Basidiobolus meristosporus CBS 931.73]|eukprot:ORY07204.1 hypothetical protein K493DRAFT_811 [Basidiobolus meristosporus CBS 931.73]